jgi:Family of unknown function (DUF6350)
MTALLTPPAAAVDVRHRRPLVLVATLAGAMAAASTLLVCMAVGMVGWFLTDAGAHGAPRDGLRTGALGWLMAHGSGVHVSGVPVTAVPLGLTLVCAWTVWRIAHRVGGAISGHGPDADRIADGERDWTVPTATTLFAAGYVVVTVVTGSLASSPETSPSTGRAVVWSLALVAMLGAPALAVGSGRAANWVARLPAAAPPALAAGWSVVRTFWLVSAVAVLAALVVDLGTALNVLSQLGVDASGATLYSASSLLVAPNAVLFGGSYLLGPGFAVGAGTLVTPTAVVLGALPLFPLLAALPDTGPTPVWTPALMALPPLVAAVAVARAQRRRPTLRWDEGALRGCAAGIGAGIVVGLTSALAGGSVGPGRMQVVAPHVQDVLVHAVSALGLGGLLGGLAMTWWQRRSLRATAERAGPTP